MIRQTFQFELLTPCFCGGAEPALQAEIRSASIRGQLRWWFRVLGGFDALDQMPLRTQEAMVFGTIAVGRVSAGNLALRVHAVSNRSSVRDGQELGHKSFSDAAYLTFPIQTREAGGRKVGYNGRGVLGEETTFNLDVVWRGKADLWRSVEALIAVFGQIGAIGFRGRRAMGALASQVDSPSLTDALRRFAAPNQIEIYSLGEVATKSETVSELGAWLRSWRAHGRTGNNAREQTFPGFDSARGDHDHGLARLNLRPVPDEATSRPAIGLPIVQYFSSRNRTVTWESADGRFASPILLRPYRVAHGCWHPLVIFVEARRWSAGHRVYLNGDPRDVSLDLYEAMKADERLHAFR